MAAGQEVRARIQAQRKDGGFIDLDLVAVPLCDGAGAAGGWLSVARDISDQVATTRALSEREEQLRSIVTAMAEGVVLQDARGAIVSANAAAERILGLTRDQLDGRTSIDPRWRSVREDGTPFPGS